MARKPRGDSVLKTLPEERQKEIAEYAAGHTLAETVQWLAAVGPATSSTALSDFLSWWHLRSQFRTWERDALDMKALLRQSRPDLPESELQGYANEYFQLKAVKENDPKTFLAFATARHKARMDELTYGQKERELALAQARFQRETAELFLKWYADKRAGEIASGELSNAEKIERLGSLMFGEIWQKEGS